MKDFLELLGVVVVIGLGIGIALFSATAGMALATKLFGL